MPRKYTEPQRSEHNAYVAAEKRARIAAGAELGELRRCQDVGRRARAEESLSSWSSVYCSYRHKHRASGNHGKMYDSLSGALGSGETWLALQAPRGEAKSFKSVEAITYAVMTGRKHFVCCFTSSMSTTETLVQYFEGQFLQTDTVFSADYPEVFQALEVRGNYAQRKVTYGGEDIRLTWGATKNGKRIFRFPTLPGVASSGAVVVFQSVTSKIRGMGFVDEKGIPLRPDLLLLDDVQDLEISQSEDRISKLLEKFDKDILGLSGDAPMSVIVLGTPFHDQCFMSRILRDRRFDGVSLQAVYKFPNRMDLWEKYRTIWEEEYDAGVLEFGSNERKRAASRAYAKASSYYQQHRLEMDAGCEISWPERYAQKYTGVSAIENIMREYLLILREEAFQQEKQCIVGARVSEEVERLDEDKFLGKISHTLEEWVSPDWASKLTAAIDVHGNVLYYTVAAWGPNFDGHTIAYGTWPQQPNTAWKQSKVPFSLRKMYAGAGEAGAMRAALDALVGELLNRTYRREDGSEIYLEKIVLDNNNGLFRKTVSKFLKESEYREKLVGYVGDWYASGHQPRKRTEEGGLEWKYIEGTHRREVIAFRDFWKAYALSRWLTPVGDGGCMTLFKGGPSRHRRFFMEMTAKKYRPVRLSSGKTMLRWDDKAERDDHYGDCDTMNFIAASICKIGQKAELDAPRHRKRVKYSELQKQKWKKG
ncbi:MAG: phage terminase large subunit family protein [Planctomycetia bacterium]|nr:phage terminase large subunit family protein [Planctomycetia bacterium]